MIDSTTYFLAYFYPRVAVYDDYQGWDFTTFNDALEFYNDFNDYILRVEVPSNYLVWATGHLMNPDEVLQKNYAEKYIRGDGGQVVLSNGVILDVSKRKKSEFLKAIGH